MLSGIYNNNASRVNINFFLGIILVLFCTTIFATPAPFFSSKRYIPDRLITARKPTSPLVINSVAAAEAKIKAPAKNKAMLWSGIEFNRAQQFAKEQKLQTLEQSVGPEVLQHPDATDKTKWVAFWGYFSQGFANKVAAGGTTEIAIALQAPTKKLTGPSDPFTDGRLVAASDAARFEIPKMKSSKIKINAFHPDVAGAAGKDMYELWPNDQGYKWQTKWKIAPAGRLI